ncbi:MAG: HAD family hydrolase [Lachnospiraceae bacterium]|nr:HAD family hydrolase [Lachnospiraceae bacterium]
MKKVIFIDYTGTMVKEDEPYTRELLAYFISHSDIKDPKEILRLVWGKVKEIEAESFGDAFVKLDERTERILEYCVRHCGLKGDLDHMHEVWRKIWVHAPLFDDVKPFFERSKLPIYVLSNDDLCYLEESMSLKGLHPAGIISSEMARACKPNRAIFEKALEIACVSPDEAVFIGDSVTSDIDPALELGITPIYISREKEADLGGVRVIRSLDEVDAGDYSK